MQMQCRQARQMSFSVKRILYQTTNAFSRPHINRQFILFPLNVRQLHRNKAHFMALVDKLMLAQMNQHTPPPIHIISPSMWNFCIILHQKPNPQTHICLTFSPAIGQGQGYSCWTSLLIINSNDSLCLSVVWWSTKQVQCLLKAQAVALLCHLFN